MEQVAHFEKVLDSADRLSLEEQEELVQILQKRIIEYRRDELSKEIKAADREFKRGKVQKATPDELMKDITRFSLAKTLLISLIVHAVLIGLTSIAFIVDAVKHGTLDPVTLRQVRGQVKQKADGQGVSGKMSPKAAAAKTKKAPATGSANNSEKRAESRMEKKLKEVSKERPKAPDVTLEDVTDLE